MGRDKTFVEQEVAFLDDVFVESVFRFPSDSVIDLLPVHEVREDLFLVLESGKNRTITTERRDTHALVSPSGRPGAGGR